MKQTDNDKKVKPRQKKVTPRTKAGKKPRTDPVKKAAPEKRKPSGSRTKNAKTADQYKVPVIRPAADQAEYYKTNIAVKTAAGSKRSVKKGKKPRRATAVFICLLLAASIVAAAVKLGLFDLSVTSAGISSFFSSFGTGKGYPYSISDSNIIASEKIGSGIMLLDDDSLRILNSTAKELRSVQHNYSNPALDTANGRAVLFDMASGRLMTVSRSGVLFEKDMGINIFTASIGRKGNVAVATKSDSMQSKLTVFDKNKKQVFVWECAAERISAVALSANGKSAAVAVIGAEYAELYSKVIIFDFDKSEPAAVFNYPETALIKLKYGSGNTLIAAGDTLYSVISLITLQQQDYPYADGRLSCLHMQESGKTSIVLSAFGNKMQNTLKVYSSKGILLYEKSFNQETRRVSGDAGYVSILLADEVQNFDNNGKQIGMIKADKYTEAVLVTGKKTYLIEKGLISQYSTVNSNK